MLVVASRPAASVLLKSAVGVAAASSSSPLASTSRAFSVSAPTKGKSPPGKGKNAIKKAKQEARRSKAVVVGAGEAVKPKLETLPLEEAARIFQAVEVTRPLNAYELHIVTSVSSHQANALRGRLALPKEARLKSERFLIFAEDDSPVSRAVEVLKESSASMRDNIVMGGQEMIKDVVEGKGAAGGDFTKVISTPALLPQVTRALARSLGPKGLMPNVKRGTVVSSAQEMNKAIREAQGAVTWRGDRNGVVRGAVGRISFTAPELRSNISAYLQAIVEKVSSGLSSGSASTEIFTPSSDAEKATPQMIKRASNIIRQVHLSSTQGPSVRLALTDVM